MIYLMGTKVKVMSIFVPLTVSVSIFSFDNARIYIRNIKSITLVNYNIQIIEELNIADILIPDTESAENSDRVIFLKEDIPDDLHWGSNGLRRSQT